MSEPWNELKDAIFLSLKEALRGFLDQAEVDKFIEEKALQFAREKYLAETASTPAKRQEHLDNLRHLQSQIEGEVATLEIAASTLARETLTRILEAAGGILLRLAPKILGGIL